MPGPSPGEFWLGHSEVFTDALEHVCIAELSDEVVFIDFDNLFVIDNDFQIDHSNSVEESVVDPGSNEPKEKFFGIALMTTRMGVVVIFPVVLS